MIDLERIMRPVVEGQIRGFLKEHPALVDAVDWYKPRADKSITFVNSLSKRIVRDLTRGTSAARLEAAWLESVAGVLSGSAVETVACGHASRFGTPPEPAGDPNADALQIARNALAAMMVDLGYQPKAATFDDLLEECRHEIANDLLWAILNSSAAFGRAAALLTPRAAKDPEIVGKAL